jgi:hypothetical protein
MEVCEALEKLKEQVENGNYEVVPRSDRRKSPVKSSLIPIIVAALSIDDFEKYEEDRDVLGTYVWVFITEDGIRYYVKFKFIENDRVKFLSVHEALY